jgi:inositol oxygenase
VEDNYRMARTHQTVEHVWSLRLVYGTPAEPATMAEVVGVWEALRLLDIFVDLSDPDVHGGNSVHALQTARSMRLAGEPDWFQVTCRIHDLGKVIYVRGREEWGTTMGAQWSVVGDTFIVGHPLPVCLPFAALFNSLHADRHNAGEGSPTARSSSLCAEACGLDRCLVSYGHDEYLYQVLRRTPGVA